MKYTFKPQWARGTFLRRAHCDLPEGTYEREISKEGFFGPSAFFRHRGGKWRLPSALSSST